ncbi:MAG TPA: flagellar basal body rod protein FlgC [Porticoccaceae bacterium]|nr:flagellar basal body rod protein FlgC [Porticoccaceae bacterium]
MSLFDLLGVSATALTAQSVRLNTISSNLANAETVSGSPEGAYKARHPVFATVMADAFGKGEGLAGVRVDRIVESEAPPRKEYMPGHTLADDDGYIYYSNVNAVAEMANMISASRSYQNTVEVMNTSKQLLLQTLNIGR